MSRSGKREHLVAANGRAMKSGEIQAVEMVRRIREEQHRILKDKTPEERRAFYRQQARALHERLGFKRDEKQSA